MNSFRLDFVDWLVSLEIDFLKMQNEGDDNDF